MAAVTSTHQPLSGPDRDRLQRASELLLRARREMMPLHDLPEELQPRSLHEAYALQDMVGLALSPISGWKIGAPSPEATPLFSPMPSWGGYISSGGTVSRDLRRLRGVEAEIAFLMGRDLPPRQEPYSRDEVVAALASAHPAVELLESAFLDPEKAGRFSVIGDLQSNGGFAYGPGRSDWDSSDLSQETVTVYVDDAVRFNGTASNTAGTDLLRLLTYLANEGSARTGGLHAGDWITTGSWSGKTPAHPGARVLVSFSTFGEVSLTFE